MTIYKKPPEPHLTQHEIHIQQELMDTAEFHVGTHTGFYVQEIKKKVHNQSNWKSSSLVVPEPNLYSWWCRHLSFITSGASFLPFPLVAPTTFASSFFSGAFIFTASSARITPFPIVVPVSFVKSFFKVQLLFTASGASLLTSPLVVSVMCINSFFSGAFTFLASGASLLPLSTGGACDVS